MHTSILMTAVNSLGRPGLKATTLVYLALLIGGVAPGAAQDRWQVQLHSGRYLYELRLVKLQGDSLVVRQANQTLTLPVREIDQVELVGGTMMRLGARVGAHDVVYQLTLLNLDERLAVLREIFQRYPRSNAPTP